MIIGDREVADRICNFNRHYAEVRKQSGCPIILNINLYFFLNTHVITMPTSIGDIGEVPNSLRRQGRNLKKAGKSNFMILTQESYFLLHLRVEHLMNLSQKVFRMVGLVSAILNVCGMSFAVYQMEKQFHLTVLIWDTIFLMLAEIGTASILSALQETQRIKLFEESLDPREVWCQELEIGS